MLRQWDGKPSISRCFDHSAGKSVRRAIPCRTEPQRPCSWLGCRILLLCRRSKRQLFFVRQLLMDSQQTLPLQTMAAGAVITEEARIAAPAVAPRRTFVKVIIRAFLFGSSESTAQCDGCSYGTPGLFASLRKLILSSDGTLGAVCPRSPAAPWRSCCR
jgi:hypothetical protein